MSNNNVAKRDMGVIAVKESGSEAAGHLSTPRPAFDWLMLHSQEEPDVSAGGINLQALQKVPLPYGLILDKGPDCSEVFKIGQHILYPLHAGIDLPMAREGKMVYLKFIREEDVICTFELSKDETASQKSK